MVGGAACPGSRRGPPSGVTVFANARINKSTSYPCIAPRVQKHAPPRLCANATYRRTLVAMLCYMYEMNNRCFSVFPSALTLAAARKQRNNDAIECIGVGKSLESVESLLSRA
ncbi:hypothetical protein EG867_16120 [Enterococcus faecalis]|nr:hypothetical protein EG867_16120 [Enterococcus faecalis]